MAPRIGLGNAHDSVIARQRRALQPRRHRAGRLEWQPHRGQRCHLLSWPTALRSKAARTTRSSTTSPTTLARTASPWKRETLDANGNPVGGILIAGNTANGNLGDGISVGGAGHRHRQQCRLQQRRVWHPGGRGQHRRRRQYAAWATASRCSASAWSARLATGAPPTRHRRHWADTKFTGQPANGSSTADARRVHLHWRRQCRPGHRACASSAASTLHRTRRRQPPEPGEPVEPPDVDNWLECESP